jgi:O-antigen/teichoic acid export membrane protein
MTDRAAHPVSMLRHSAVYLLARGLPGVIAFLAIPIYTRMLQPEQYGRYVLAVAYATLCNALLYNWIRAGLLRYFPAYHDREGELRAAVFTLNLAVSGGIVALSALLFVVGWNQPWREFVVPACLLAISFGTFELFLEHDRARLRPWDYSRKLLVKSVLSITAGVVFIRLGFGWWGPVLGLVVSMLLPAAWTYAREWASLGLKWDRPISATIARFGIPISATVALAAVMISTDRFLIAWFLGEDSAGVYAAGADLTAQSLTMLMMIVNLAGYPLAMRQFERGGAEAARGQLKQNLSMLLILGLPAAAGLAVLAPGIASLVLGEGYRVAAARVIPLIAIGAFFAGLKAYYFDHAFQFAERTITQVWIVLMAAIVNVVLNLVLIPRQGIAGAAVAAVVAHVVSLGITIVWGRRYFPLPFSVRTFLQVFAATAVMVALICVIPTVPGRWDTILRITAGAAAYGTVMAVFNFGRVKHLVRPRPRQPDAVADAIEPLGSENVSRP